MKRSIVYLLLALLPFFLYSQEVNPIGENKTTAIEEPAKDNLSTLEDALKNRDIEKVNSILENCSSDEEKSFEDRILAYSKKAVNSDDLDYAYQLAEIVLMNDLDNREAQKLYTSLEKAKKAKAEALAKEAAKEKQRKEDEERNRQIQAYNEIKEKEAREKEEFQKSVSTISYKNFPISVALSPAVLDFTSSSIAEKYKSDNKMIIKYGIGAVADIGFRHPYLIANAHANYSYEFLDFNGKGQKSNLAARLTFGTPIISEYVRLSVGFNSFSYKDDKDSVFMKNSNAFTLGYGLEKVKIGQHFSFDIFADINTLTFEKDNYVDFAFDVDLSLRYDLPMAVKGKKLYIQNNTFCNAYSYSQNWESFVNNSISIGVVINE